MFDAFWLTLYLCGICCYFCWRAGRVYERANIRSHVHAFQEARRQNHLRLLRSKVDYHDAAPR